MKRRILEFIESLRQTGLVPGPGECIDAICAVSEAGVERSVLRESLAATLVKDHADRPNFDEVFDRYFALPEQLRAKPKRHRRAPGDEGGSGARRTQSEGRRGVADRKREEERRGEQRSNEEEWRGEKKPITERAGRLAQRRSLLAKPFREMDPRDVEELRDSLRDLAERFRLRCARRLRRASRGRLDPRRTIRRALSRGGVPIELLLRRPRPRKADLVGLVDLSYSTATAAEFLLGVLAPARSYFRRVTFFAYVDAPVQVSFEHGHVVPHAPLDLNARSDFGTVLRRLDEDYALVPGRNTVLLVLGDARNNRRPPRADLFARLRSRVRSVVWLNPEPPAQWNTGDSVMAAYARHIDILLPAAAPSELCRALSRVARLSVG